MLKSVEKIADEILKLSKNEKNLSEDELCVLVLLHIIGGMLLIDDEDEADKFLDDLLRVTEEKLLAQRKEETSKKPEKKKTELEEYLEFKKQKEERLKERIAKAKKEWKSIFGNDADFF